jgi:hypothetical protein
LGPVILREQLLASAAQSTRYKRYAAECLRLAQRTDDQKSKQILLEMAERWRVLAELRENGDN